MPTILQGETFAQSNIMLTKAGICGKVGVLPKRHTQKTVCL